MIMRSVVQVTGILAVVLLGACSAPSPKAPGSAESSARQGNAEAAGRIGSSPEALVAQDFTNVISQLPGFEPQSTTLQFFKGGDLKNPFVSSLRSNLSAVGYGVQLVADDVGDRLVEYQISHGLMSDSGATDMYSVSIGGTSLQREYRVSDSGRIEPVTELYVKGSDTRELLTDDSIFGGKEQRTLQPLRPDTTEPMRPFTPKTPVSDVPGQMTGGVAPAGVGVASVSTPSTQNMPPAAIESTANIGDAIAELPASYRDGYSEDVILFPSGSYELDEADFRMISDLTGKFDAEANAISLMGCSLDGEGNQDIALTSDRVIRVKRALVAAGVPSERLKVETCLIKDAKARVRLRQGVQVTLLRVRQ